MSTSKHPKLCRGCRPLLPTELFQPIMEQLAGCLPELRSCARTSRVLRDEAQRILFRVVMRAADRKRRAARFFNVIINSPDRLALYVRVIRLNMTYELDENLIGLANAAFHGMVSLKHLIVSGAEHTAFGCARLLRGVTFKLEGLDWGCREEEQELWNDFLPSQNQIKYIRLQDCVSTGAGATAINLANMLPELEYIDGPEMVLRALLPGHHRLRVVVWDRFSGVYHHELPSHHSAQYEEGIGRIECLSYRMFRISSITDIGPFLVSLRVLELCGYEISDLQVLKDLRCIEHLILSADPSGQGSYNSDTLRVQLSKHAFHLSATLQCLDIQGLNLAVYMRLQRSYSDDAECIQQVTIEEVRWYWQRYTNLFK